MKKHVILILLIFSILAISPQGYPKAEDEKIVSELSNKLISFIRNGDFEGASELFHYPPALTPEEASKEKAKLIQKLKTVNEEFGGLVRFRSGKTSQTFIGVGVSGAEISYWEDGNIKFRQIIFPVEFKNDGPGFLKIGFCDINNIIQIQGVEYALPKSAKSKNRISEINRKIGQKEKDNN